MEGIPPPPAMVALWRCSEDYDQWRAYSEDGGYYGEIPTPTDWTPLQALPVTQAENAT